MSVLSPPRPTAAPAAPRHVDRGAPAALPRHGLARGHDPPRVVARRPELPDARFGAGGRRQPPARRRSASARRSRCGCVADPRPPVRAAVAAGVPHASRPTGSRCSLAQGVLIAYAVLWVVLTIDTLRLVRLVKTGAGRALRDRDRGRRPDVPLERHGGVRRRTSRASRAARSASIFGASGPSVPPSDGYYNILLLGADSGVGRDSMRFDSISVVSVNATTGATTITGIPRDMPHFPFARGPDAGPVPERTRRPRRRDAAGGGAASTSCAPRSRSARTATRCIRTPWRTAPTPGIEATKDAAEGILGIKIPYYVFIDMHGFASLVDALGGVDITVDRAPAQGRRARVRGQPAEEWAIGWIEPGRSTWTATPRSGTPVRGTRRPTSIA